LLGKAKALDEARKSNQKAAGISPTEREGLVETQDSIRNLRNESFVR
jgi:hypothetical protein